MTIGGWFGVVAWLLLSGCTINKDIMFQTPSDFPFDDLSTVQESDYRIAPNDFLDFRLFSNGGQRLLLITAGTQQTGQQVGMMNQQAQQTSYWVRPNGLVELPEIGDIQLAGLTIQEAQDALEAAYASLYHDPYAMLTVTNNRVMVFPGASGAARVITIQNLNTSVLEALALAGGISPRGNAEVVKLIRMEGDERRVFEMNLSTIEGLADASTTVQAGDIVYVEPVPEIASEITRDIAPYLSLMSSISLIFAVLNNLGGGN
jgi:polysaccharide export outer membrane protein